jgi:phenylalanyl-tRNA synthetase beta chain
MLTGKKFQSLSRFPDVCRDSALLVDNEVSAEQVFAVIDQARGRFVEDFTLFDTYRGPGIADDKKSLAIRVRYRSSDKTLTEEEITAGHERIIKALRKKLGAEIR